MKPGRIYNCKTCRDSGRVRSASGALEPCPNCRWGAIALAQSQSWNEPAVGKPKPARVVAKSAPPRPGRAPAEVGRTLKIILYSSVAAATWAMYRCSRDETTVEDTDELNGPDTPGPRAPNDFSPWEPES